MSPSALELFEIVKTHYGSGQATRVARLLMSIHNGDTRISFYNDLQGFDEKINVAVGAVIIEFLGGLYQDGDFTPIAEWLYDHGYLSDVDRAEFEEWVEACGDYLERGYLSAKSLSETFEQYALSSWRAEKGI